MPGPSSVTASRTRPPSRQPKISIRPPSRGVLGGVLEEVLEQPAEQVGRADREERPLREGRVSRWRRRIDPSDSTIVSTTVGDVDRPEGRRLLAQDAQAGQDRVDHRVEPVDLAEGLRLQRAVPSTPPAAGRRADELEARPDDRERRPQLVGDDRDEAGARLVDRPQAVDLGLRLGLQPALLDDPGEQRRERLEEADVAPPELAAPDGLDVEHADDRVVPDERHRAHRGEARLVEALEPGEACDRAGR